MSETLVSQQEEVEAAIGSGFQVNLEVYSGPFDALLGMIANNKLELTEVSLSSITEEFLAYVRGLDFTKNMDEASAFLDVASILVEAKSVAILPGGEENQHDEQSLEALRERDLLFARLIQYRAYKQRPAISARDSPPIPGGSPTRLIWMRHTGHAARACVDAHARGTGETRRTGDRQCTGLRGVGSPTACAVGRFAGAIRGGA